MGTVTAEAITTEVMAIVRGDQNPVFTEMGGLVVGSTVVGVSFGVPVGAGDEPWVTVKVVVAEPVEPVTVTGYVPGGTCGTMIITCAIAPNVVAVPTFFVPKVRVTEGSGNPRT